MFDPILVFFQKANKLRNQASAQWPFHGLLLPALVFHYTIIAGPMSQMLVLIRQRHYVRIPIQQLILDLSDVPFTKHCMY